MNTASPARPLLGSVLRIGKALQSTANQLGPLADLCGTWMGNRGWELIAVPFKNDFRLIVRPYIETITFAPLGAPIPNRGGPVPDLFISGLQYEVRIADAETNQPLHVENGMWLFLDGQTPPVARMALIPHGDAVMSLGNSSTVDGPPAIPDLDALPITGKGAPLGYADAWLRPVDGFLPASPNRTLQAAIREQDIVKTVTLDVSTTNSGGILNIPFVTKNANTTAFRSTFWIETVRDASGQEFQQLQYSQVSDLEFLPRFDDPSKLIIWPHVNINTLLKQ